MPNTDILIAIGAVAALVLGYFFVRRPRWRWHIAIGGLLAAGVGVSLTWYLLFRIDDPTFVADKAAAEAQQAELDALFEAPPAGAVEAPPAAEQAPTPALTGGRKAPLAATEATVVGTLPDGVGVPVGEVAPDFTVQDLNGAAVTLASLVSERPVVLVFYRGGWCPFCNTQVYEFARAEARFTELGLGVAFVSVDSPDGGQVTQASWEVPFSLLADPDLAAHHAFRVVNAVGREDYERLVGFGMDLEAWSGRTHHTIAIPSIFLVDTSRTVRWAHAAHDYKTRPSVDHVIAALRSTLDRAL